MSEHYTSELHPTPSVCPRVKRLNQSSSRIRIPVKICNISAKPLIIKPRSNICSIQEVKVVDSLATDCTCKSPELNKKSTWEGLGVHIDTNKLNDDQLCHVRQLLSKWKPLFSTSQFHIGNTDLVKHKITLEDERPFKLSYRKIPPCMYDEVRQHLKEMLDAGVIRESSSPFASNIVLVRKNDGSLTLWSVQRQKCHLSVRRSNDINVVLSPDRFV